MDVGMREADVFLKGPGPGPRVGDPFAAGRWAARALDHRYHADPAQRLPPAQEAARVIADFRLRISD